jgi:hypothetical protein
MKDSFKIYRLVNDGIIRLIDLFFEMTKLNAMKALDVYRKATSQGEALERVYRNANEWERFRETKFPQIENPPASFLQTMEEYAKSASSEGAAAQNGAQGRAPAPAQAPAAAGSPTAAAAAAAMAAREAAAARAAPPPAPRPPPAGAPAGCLLSVVHVAHLTVALLRLALPDAAIARRGANLCSPNWSPARPRALRGAVLRRRTRRACACSERIVAGARKLLQKLLRTGHRPLPRQPAVELAEVDVAGRPGVGDGSRSGSTRSGGSGRGGSGRARGARLPRRGWTHRCSGRAPFGRGGGALGRGGGRLVVERLRGSGVPGRAKAALVRVGQRRNWGCRLGQSGSRRGGGSISRLWRLEDAAIDARALRGRVLPAPALVGAHRAAATAAAAAMAGGRRRTTRRCAAQRGAAGARRRRRGRPKRGGCARRHGGKMWRARRGGRHIAASDGGGVLPAAGPLALAVDLKEGGPRVRPAVLPVHSHGLFLLLAETPARPATHRRIVRHRAASCRGGRCGGRRGGRKRHGSGRTGRRQHFERRGADARATIDALEKPGDRNHGRAQLCRALALVASPLARGDEVPSHAARV